MLMWTKKHPQPSSAGSDDVFHLPHLRSNKSPVSPVRSPASSRHHPSSRTTKLICVAGAGPENVRRDDSDDDADYSGGNVHVITSNESWDEKISEARRDGKIVVANFTASWCGPCKMIIPLYVEMSVKYPSLLFLAVDVDHLVDLSSSWDIHATPTFFFLKDGEQVDKLVGANKPELSKKVAMHAESLK